jgi:hypothetical protein
MGTVLRRCPCTFSSTLSVSFEFQRRLLVRIDCWFEKYVILYNIITWKAHIIYATRFRENRETGCRRRSQWQSFNTEHLTSADIKVS